MTQTSRPSTLDSRPIDAIIRALEEQSRTAFLAGDVDMLGQLWADGLLVNSPLEQVNERAMVLKLLQSGRIRHTSLEVAIERITRHGDVVIVMGNDTVTDPPDDKVTHRRFTNVWQLQDGRWRMIARHAQAVRD
ncbi:MAG TPA: nuclear transport factor 2 family protein [Gemmatimonadales bacterium]|nr:nuclear transport factor 2 family protein [Gemmatimonadales bacterium]